MFGSKTQQRSLSELYYSSLTPGCRNVSMMNAKHVVQMRVNRMDSCFSWSFNYSSVGQTRSCMLAGVCMFCLYACMIVPVVRVRNLGTVGYEMRLSFMKQTVHCLYSAL